MSAAGPATESVDFALAAYREEGVWQVAELTPDHATDVETLVSALRRFPGDGGVVGLVAIDEDFFVVVRVTGQQTRVMLSDITAASEWELAAGAGFTQPDGSKEPEFLRAIARWYGTPAPAVLPAAGSGRPNYYGLRDLHGLVWEWTADFNSAIVTGDARGDTGLERQLFCGAGAVGAGDPSNYPAFMRFGFRSSLKAAYTVHNLGFRYAKDP